MNKRLLAAGLAVALGLGSSLAFAQAKPDVLVKQRQASMTLIGKYWGPLVPVMQGRAPYNAELVARNAGFIEALSKMPWDGFDASTSGETSNALPEVFSNQAKFKEAGDRMQVAATALAAAARGGNEGTVKAAMGDLGKTCGACHNDFRKKQ